MPSKSNGKPIVSNPAQTFTTLIAVASAVGGELQDFAAERLKANAERLRAWSKVRTPGEYIDAEMRFAAQTMGIYADEALHLQEVIEAAAATAAEQSDS